MKKRIMGLSILFMLIGGSAANAQTNSTMKTDIREAVTNLHNKYMQAWDDTNAAAVAATYSDDAILMAPNAELVTGREAITRFIEQGNNSRPPNLKLKIDLAELEQHGNTAYLFDKYSIIDENGQTLDHGKSLIILKNNNGSWKIYRHIWNSDLPPNMGN